MAKPVDGDESLKRLGGGRWQTRDDRFTIEPQSGTWVVVDGEQVDELGLPLVRGPFGSLGDAKAAIASARVSDAPVRPLPKPARPTPSEGSGGASAGVDKHGSRKAPAAAKSKAAREPTPKPTPKPTPPPEPRWLTDLAPKDRRRARQTIAALATAGASDPEGVTRRDIVGGVAAVATFGLGRRLRALGPDPTPRAVAALVSDGRDDALGVRWRLVDGEGRPIVVDPRDLTGD